MYSGGNSLLVFESGGCGGVDSLLKWVFLFGTMLEGRTAAVTGFRIADR